MIYVFVVPFIVLVILFFVLAGALKQKKKRAEAFAYGKSQFDVELPYNPNALQELVKYKLPLLQNCSDAECFMILIIPYIGSLHGDKRQKIQGALEDMSANLKVNKEIYRAFMDEYEKYDGLSDDEASDKWRGKEKPE
ncbi:MAG: hypothetical protein HRT94_00370 [Alphaproteobacteria bacterium]|nr:hypothetical protein [Alphaproteobacteria bacterium]